MKQIIASPGMRLVIGAVIIGLASAFGLARVLASQLFGVQPIDPACSRSSVVVALIAVWVPAARASRLDPLTALRCE